MAIELTTEFEQMLTEAAHRKASDLHLVAGEPPVFRVQGEIVRSEQDPLSAADLRKIVHAAIGQQQADRLGKELGDVITTCSIEGLAEGRMCITRAMDAFSIVVCMMAPALPDPQETRIPQALLDAALSSHGLILLTGLTGSGKNTAALLLVDYINSKQAASISTVEDPVVVRLVPKKSIIRQQSVDTDTPGFAAGLRAILRQDPDVVYVSEIRDVTVLQACMTMAQLGHLVFSVVHGSSPEAVIQKLIDVQPDDMRGTFRRSLAETLIAVAISALLPAATGKGRLGTYGLLMVGDEIRRAIREGRSLLDVPGGPGSQALADDIKHLQADGHVTAEAAQRLLERIRHA